MYICMALYTRNPCRFQIYIYMYYIYVYILYINIYSIYIYINAYVYYQYLGRDESNYFDKHFDKMGSPGILAQHLLMSRTRFGRFGLVPCWPRHVELIADSKVHNLKTLGLGLLCEAKLF